MRLSAGAESVLQRRPATGRRHLHAAVTAVWAAVRRRSHHLRSHSHRRLGTHWIRHPPPHATCPGRPASVPAEIIYVTSHTQTHTHPFNGPLSRTTRVGRYQKGKTNLDFTEARDSEWEWHQLDQSAPHSRQITTPAPHRSGRMPFLPPNQQRQSTEDNLRYLGRKQTATAVQQLWLLTYCCFLSRFSVPKITNVIQNRKNGRFLGQRVSVSCALFAGAGGQVVYEVSRQCGRHHRPTSSFVIIASCCLVVRL